MPRDLRPVNSQPLSESEEYQLRRLLDRRSQSLPEAQAQRDRERERERRLEEKRDRLAAAEAKLSKRIAELRIDIDTVSAEIFKIAPSGVAFRHVAGKLQEFGDRAPSFSYFNTQADTLDRDQLMLLAEIALAVFEMDTRPKGKSLREKMQNVAINIGLDAPGDGGAAPDNRAALARAIVEAGKKRRGES
jgi:hypothetical protein